MFVKSDVRSFNRFEAININGQNISVVTSPWPRPFFKKFKVHVRTDLGNVLSNLKSPALTVLELYAFKAWKFWVSRDPGHAPFQKIVRDHV